MKVILLEDVKAVGKKGEIHEVSDAFARNVLFRKNQAKEATGKNLNDLKLKKANDEKVAAEELAAAQELAKKIETMELHLSIKVGEGGKVFGSVSTKEIAEEIKKQLSLTVDKKKILLDQPIRELGETKLPIKLHTKVTAKLKTIVSQA